MPRKYPGFAFAMAMVVVHTLLWGVLIGLVIAGALPPGVLLLSVLEPLAWLVNLLNIRLPENR